MKTFLWRLLGGVFLVAGSVAAHADQFGDFNYVSDGSTITIIGYAGPGGDVAIPDTVEGLPVTSIGGAAFYGCTGLTSVTIPNSVTSIWDYAFSGCSGLAVIEVGAQNPIFSGLDGVLFNKDQTRLVVFPGGKAGSYTIPNSLTFIGQGTFSGCSGLTGAYFAGAVPAIGDFGPPFAFSECPALIVYHRAGARGWEATFEGHPTALWIDPPVYSQWIESSGLRTQFPNATTEAEDPDGEGLSNYAEMLAGTDPTDRTSLLTLERTPRPADLTAAELAPIEDNQHAVYFQSVPGKSYGAQWAESLGGPWNTVAVVTATTTQKRLVFHKPATQAFYRVILAQ